MIQITVFFNPMLHISFSLKIIFLACTSCTLNIVHSQNFIIHALLADQTSFVINKFKKCNLPEILGLITSDSFEIILF